jgi:uncharacterized protein (TIGR03437 family)
MSEYSGISALDQTAVHAAKGSFTGTFSSGVQIIGTAGELIFGHCELWKGTAQAGSGFTLRSTFKGDVDESSNPASTGSYAATCVDSGSGPIAMMATFKPATPPVGGTTSQTTLTSAPVKAMTTGMLPSQEKLRSLSCSPKTATPGSVVTCELRASPNPSQLDAQLSSDSDSLRVPNHIAIGANRERLTFQAAADAMAGNKPVTITASLGESTAHESVLIASSLAPAISAPTGVNARVGEPVNFTVRAADPAGLPIEVVAIGMPSQAEFDSARGRFEWIPSATQTGSYLLTFTATNSAGSSLVRVLVSISTGVPALDTTAGLTCSPGAPTLVRGQSLDSVTRIQVNGQNVSPLDSSAEQVALTCPDLPAGTALSLTVETDDGKSAHITGIMKEVSPRILRLIHPDSHLVLARDFTESSYPAQPGDEVVLLATGLGGSPAMFESTVRVRFGATEARVSAVSASEDPGVYAIHVIVPDMPSAGDVPVELLVTASGGVEVASNPINAMIEP